MAEPELRDQLMLAGATPGDLAWFDRIGWDDARVPEPTPAEVADYQRRESLLNATLTAETFAERGASHAGRLAAAIGARLADLRDREAGEEEAD